MFDISFPELILIAIVGLLVIGPERLPEALRTLGLWIGRMRRSFTNVKTEIEKEIGMDEIRRQLHNEAVMEEMKRIERDVRNSVSAGESGATHSAAGDTKERAPTPRLEPTHGSRPTPAAPDASGESGEAAAEPLDQIERAPSEPDDSSRRGQKQ